MSAQAGTDAGASTVSTQQLEQDDVPLTGPLGKCCTRTVPHSGVARGTVEVIAGLATYVARPGGEGGKGGKVILYFADVFGPLYINSKLAMDYWAAHGYLVLGVDYFEGDSAAHHRGEAGWDVDEWVVPFRTSAARITPPWIEAVREAYGACARIPHIASGCRYCFGGPFVLDLLATDWVTAGAIAHPAFLDEGHFRRLKSEHGLRIPPVTGSPHRVSTAEDDFTFPSAARRRAEDIMVEQKATYYIQIFSGAVHGFATRPDPSLRAERWAKEESARAVLQWFGHHARD
ncbi:alpha/beta-hydrolase [Cubamyces menziesii]|nr:alpha/beta-hydrolase [Cubamyces menziesii]